MSTLEEIRSSGTMLVVPWHDELVDGLGHDPRSYYVERFWLPVLGPSTVFLLRLVAAALEESPEGRELDLAETARQLGLGDRAGRHAPMVRTVTRCVDFEMARPAGLCTLAVRRRLPPLARRQQLRLTTGLAAEHDRWEAAAGTARPKVSLGVPGRAVAATVSGHEGAGAFEGGAFEGGGPPQDGGELAVPMLRERGRQLALSLLQLGEDPATTAHQLIRWHYHPALAGECAAWAASEHAARGATPAVAQPFRAHRASSSPAERMEVSPPGERVGNAKPAAPGKPAALGKSAPVKSATPGGRELAGAAGGPAPAS
ncbi:MAG TPA: hypothetical protein VMD59_02470 [Acidimicrobiales bacterium]|nr:hypothetical protein [Acidimicrobiales bacterium]